MRAEKPEGYTHATPTDALIRRNRVQSAEGRSDGSGGWVEEDNGGLCLMERQT